MEFVVPLFSGEGISLMAAPTEVEIPVNHPIIRSVHTIWDLANFATARKPIVIGEIEDRSGFVNLHATVSRTLDMPIKFPGTDYRLPMELRQFKGPLERMIGYEHAINPHVDVYHAYVTVDFERIRAGRTQRRGGCHVDGFQGERIDPKNSINRSYIVANIAPTVFYPQVFEMDHLDVRRHNFFLDFDRQSDESKATRPEPFEIVLIDAYTVHRADNLDVDAFRVFLRLSYDVLKFDRLGNTKNPLFNYTWNMVAREAQKHLR